jgi:hypothetical protein
MPSHDGAPGASRPKSDPFGMQLGINPTSPGLVDYTPASLEDYLRLNKKMSVSFDACELRANQREHSNVKHSGFTEVQALELVLLVALNFLIHLVDDVAKTDNDFPVVTADAN